MADITREEFENLKKKLDDAETALNTEKENRETSVKNLAAHVAIVGKGLGLLEGKCGAKEDEQLGSYVYKKLKDKIPEKVKADIEVMGHDDTSRTEKGGKRKAGTPTSSHLDASSAKSMRQTETVDPTTFKGFTSNEAVLIRCDNGYRITGLKDKLGAMFRGYPDSLTPVFPKELLKKIAKDSCGSTTLEQRAEDKNSFGQVLCVFVQHLIKKQFTKLPKGPLVVTFDDIDDVDLDMSTTSIEMLNLLKEPFREFVKLAAVHTMLTLVRIHKKGDAFVLDVMKVAIKNLSAVFEHWRDLSEKQKADIVKSIEDEEDDTYFK